MSMLRRNLIVSALSAALVRSTPAHAQATADDDFWLDGYDGGSSLSAAEQEELQKLCNKQIEFDGYRIRYWLSDDILNVTTTFEDAGFALQYDADEDGTRDFVRSVGRTDRLNFRNVTISASYFATFAAAYFPNRDMRAPIQLRADNLDAGTSMILKATLTTGDLEPGGSKNPRYDVKLDDDARTQQQFYRFLTDSNRLMVTIGAYIAEEERWRLIKRRVYTDPQIEASLVSASRTFAEGLQAIDITACRQKCFLTTACCEAYGKPDDCYELETLRAFRDSWLQFQPGGAESIATYGVVAPKICEALARDPRRDLQLARIYWGAIVPCLALIRLGLRRPAYTLYRRLVTRLTARYGIA